MSMGYYGILRLVACTTCIYGMLYALKSEQVVWMTSMFVAAILFNPLDPIELKRTSWEVLDTLTIAFFVASIFFIRQPIKAESEEEEKKRLDPYKSILAGQILLVGAVAFWYSIVGNPFTDFAILQRGKTVSGHIINAWEDASDDDRGRTHFYHQLEYSYRLPDGREFTQRTLDKQGRIPEGLLDVESNPHPIEVEYVHDDPLVSRIKGDGADSFSDWLFRKLGLSLVLLAMFLAPGIYMLKEGIVGLKHRTRAVIGR